MGREDIPGRVKEMVLICILLGRQEHRGLIILLTKLYRTAQTASPRFSSLTCSTMALSDILTQGHNLQQDRAATILQQERTTCCICRFTSQ